jgi:hypothetical protein
MTSNKITSNETDNETDKNQNCSTIFGVKYKYITSSFTQINQALQALLYADGQSG